MYKIKEVANLLGVETVEIHKKLVNLKQELKGHTVNKHGMIQIDDKGLSIIERSFIDIDELEVTDNREVAQSEGEIASDFELDNEHYVAEEVEVDIDQKNLELKKKLYKLKNVLLLLDREIEQQSSVLEERTFKLNENVTRLKALEKEYYNSKVRR